MQRIGWALFHSIWQAAAIAVLLAVVLGLMRKASAYGTDVTDRGMRDLASFPRLRRLHLNNTAVTDVCVPELAGLSSLQDLYLMGSGVTELGAATIAEQLPGCQVDMAPPAEAEDVVDPERRKDQEKLLAEFHALYTLDDGEVLRHIPPPFPRGRRVYHQTRGQSVPAATVFHWQDDTVVSWAEFSGGPGASLSTLLEWLVGAYRVEIEGDLALIDLSIPGDWVLRDGAARPQVLARVQELLRASRFPIRLRFEEAEREVWVARGTYHFQRAEGATGDDLQLYGERLSDSKTGGGGGGTLEEFFGWAGEYMGARIVSDVENPPTTNLRWHLNEGGRGHVEAVVRRLCEQTSLTFTKEKRMVEILRVDRAE